MTARPSDPPVAGTRDEHAEAAGAPAGARRRRVPAAVWLLVLAQALLALGWSQLAPPWRAPDEPQHHDLVRVVRAEPGWVGMQRALSRQITATFDPAGFDYDQVRQLSALSAAEAPQPHARQPFAQLAVDEPSVADNWLWQHAPLYYVVTAGALILGEALTPGGALSWLGELAAARAVSALMIAPLPLLAFAAGRRLGARRAPAVAAAGLTLAVPQLAHIGGAVNNDNLLTLLVSAATLPLVGMATGDGRARPALAGGALFGAGLLVKAFALIGVALIPLAAAAGALRRRRGAVAVGQTVAGLAAMAVVGGWWLVRNVVVFGTAVPSSYDPPPFGAAQPELAGWLSVAVPGYVERFWGSFGWFQAAIPAAVAWVATAGLAGLVVVAVWRRRRARAGLAALAVAAAPAGALAAGVLTTAWSLHMTYGYYPMIQGRYMLPGLVGVLAIVAVAVDSPRAHRWWPPAVAVGVLAMVAVATTTALNAFWAGGGRQALAGLWAWSPWPTWLGVAWLTALAAVTAGLVGAVIAAVARGPASPPVVFSTPGGRRAGERQPGGPDGSSAQPGGPDGSSAQPGGRDGSNAQPGGPDPSDAAAARGLAQARRRAR
jgi:4-amino-4-deoxy-L-arabinose transferase-like glycosyltransferase